MSRRSSKFFSLAVLLLSLLAVGSRADGRAQGATAGYHALWWSVDQMVGLDPNHPPEKATPVALSKWEYSDPIGVPHPDTVTLVVSVSPNASSETRVSIRTKWRVGRRWITGPHVGPSEKVLPKGERSVSFELPVVDEINRLSPSLLRSDVMVNGRMVTHADLPVQLGD